MKCFLDLDGVLADLQFALCEHHQLPDPYENGANRGIYEFEKMWNMTPEELFGSCGSEFWANIRPTEECFDIVELAEAVFGSENVCILSSPTRVNAEGCLSGKHRWVKKHLPQYERSFLLGPKKEFCAGKNRVLLDDVDANVDRFSLAGGIGVLVPRHWNKLGKMDNLVRYLDIKLWSLKFSWA